MNLGLAALLYFGGGIAVTIGLIYAYVAITGDEYGERLLPGEPFTNQTSNQTGGNYTLPKINVPTSHANAAFYQDLSIEEEKYEPRALS